MTHPACMTPAEYAEWLKSVRATRSIESPCDLCTTKYQQAMTTAGRCDESVRVEFAYQPGSKYVKKGACGREAHAAHAATN